MTLQSVQEIHLAASAIAGETPPPGLLQLGEVAFNVADQIAFVGDGSGGHFVLGGGGGATSPDGDSIIVSGGTMSVNHLECGTFS